MVFSLFLLVCDKRNEHTCLKDLVKACGQFGYFQAWLNANDTVYMSHIWVLISQCGSTFNCQQPTFLLLRLVLFQTSQPLQKILQWKAEDLRDEAVDHPFYFSCLICNDINDVSSNIAIAIHPAEQLLQPKLMSFMSHAAFQRFWLRRVIYHACCGGEAQVFPLV